MNEQLQAFEPVLTKHLTPAPEHISSRITDQCVGLFFFFYVFFYVCPDPPALFFFPFCTSPLQWEKHPVCRK